MEIIGVDFSGARSDNNTWITRGRLDGDELVLQSCQPISRSELADMLANRPGPTIAALGYPFSVPQSFASFWHADAASMDELWPVATDIELADFIALRDDFVSRFGEPKRLCDIHYPESFSCLHKTNPNLVPMTFYGMRMLDRLWAAGCEVPPLGSEGRNGTVLLEVMPGAVLRCLGLPFKGYKNGMRASELRHEILDGLDGVKRFSLVKLRGLDEFKSLCLSTHDCLDSVVAALAAALWHLDRSLFRLPEVDPSGSLPPQVILEGWLYAPAMLREGDHTRVKNSNLLVRSTNG